MDQKHQFVSLAATGRFTFTELCADFRVSRKTGHKWVVRYRQDGAAGLCERSRRPHGCAHQAALRIAQLILRERRKHRTWGPKKLRRLLRRDHGIRRPPACSTIAAILQRCGLSQRPRRKPGLYEVARHALTVPGKPKGVMS
jgi:transposase